MKQSDIRAGQTYLFVATDSPARKHLEGQPFHVVRIDNVWRRVKRKGSRKVKRFFNEAGEGARADELEPIDDANLKASGYLTDTSETIQEAPNEPIDDLPF